jgi:hypothetical protein
MGRGKKWDIDERQKLAFAWCRVSMDPVVGRNQTGESFKLKLFDALKQNSPVSHESGTYGERTPQKVFAFWKNSVAPDVQKFNYALKKVYSCHPTGVDEQQMINMAIAIHMEKTDRMMYSMATTDPKEWLNYLAWLVVRNIPKFRFPNEELEQALESSRPPAILDVAVANNSGDNGVALATGSEMESLPEDNPTLGSNTETSSETSGRNNNETSTPGSFEMSRCGRNKAKNKLKRKGEHDDAMKQMAGELSRVNAEQALLRKTMQWKLYYKMCNKEGDADGKKKAKQALEDLLDINNDKGGNEEGGE